MSAISSGRPSRRISDVHGSVLMRWQPTIRSGGMLNARSDRHLPADLVPHTPCIGARLTAAERLARWPTPFTNSFPIRRQPMTVGERREFRMAWIFGPDLRIDPQPQAYTRLAERLYLFENLD